MKTGAELITAERERQIEQEGFHLQHDQAHSEGELIQYAVFLLTGDMAHFPKNWDTIWAHKALYRPDFENQVKAGALIAANLDRINGKSKAFE